ncbi:type IV secretion system DNA-binding domain-containing protein [uncultured Roseobacter sp.]|uniref:type IV secretion system DNA-binding domain-containing protein n=1 Tax=uncultured Roseobacter sp. TaxID=114847 RepID=UPI00262ECB9A|nr:type IV secretion system DNA-binding domain-containing protein [uncultured Roseobacter sp.]
MKSSALSSPTTLIRGGQTTQHWWRMAQQVLRFSLVLAAIGYIASFAYLARDVIDPERIRVTVFYGWAEQLVQNETGSERTFTLTDHNGEIRDYSAVELYRDHRQREIRDTTVRKAFRAAFLSLIPALLICLASVVVFYVSGRRVERNNYIRGSRLISAGELKWWSNNQWKQYVRKFKDRKKAPRYTIASVPFPPNALEAQTGFFGTVGVGKTTAMIEMLRTIRQNGGRAVIYDRMGTFVSRFYNEETDVIVNPFDDRSVAWCPFDDVKDLGSFAQMAEVMIPIRPGESDPFWTNAARIVFEHAARELYKRGERTNEALLNAILNMPADQLSELVANSPSAHFFNTNIEKTALSIRANMISHLRFLEFMRDDGPRFSIRKWMAEDTPSFVFLTADAEHTAATRNIISTITELGVNALMSQPPSADPRVFFFFDEVPALNKMPFLVTSLAQIRQFGGAFVLGYQVYSQLEEIYGREAAESITGTLNNRLVFNTPNARTAKVFSDSLGSADTIEVNANITVGAHEARDGVGFVQSRQERPIVTASEIQALPQFECYVRFAYNAPTARVTFKAPGEPEICAGFQPYLGDGFYDGRLDGGGPDNGGSAAEQHEASQDDPELFDAFATWAGAAFACSRDDWVKNRTCPPTDIAAYWAHFYTQYTAGVPPDRIQPIVMVSDPVIGNRQNASRHSTTPQPPWMSTAKAEQDVQRDLAHKKRKPAKGAKSGPSRSSRSKKPTRSSKKKVTASPVWFDEYQGDV